MLNEIIRMGTCCINLGDISFGEVDFHQLLHGEPAPKTEETDEKTAAISGSCRRTLSCYLFPDPHLKNLCPVA